MGPKTERLSLEERGSGAERDLSNVHLFKFLFP